MVIKSNVMGTVPGETFKQIINSNTPVLVDFFAEWCGPCKMMVPVLKQLRDKMQDNLRIIKIDVDKNPSVAQAFAVQGVPTMVLFKSGQILWRQSGALSLPQLEVAITQYI